MFIVFGFSFSVSYLTISAIKIYVKKNIVFLHYPWGFFLDGLLIYMNEYIAFFIFECELIVDAC
jgi:hypothetical protein